MPETQREIALLALLKNDGQARVLDLARNLNVTEETIRRAVRRLESKGLVKKVHGGVHLRDWGAETSFALRLGINMVAKRRIATRLAGLIPDGSSLFLDVGSTTHYVAQALRNHRDLTVVTNSLAVAQSLTSRNGNRIFMAGGELRALDGGAFGAEALAFVRQFHVGHAILSAVALDAKAGFMLQDMREAEFARAIIKRADKAIIAMDATKFGERAPICIASADLISQLVTDSAPPDDIAAMLAHAGVELVLA